MYSRYIYHQCIALCTVSECIWNIWLRTLRFFRVFPPACKDSPKTSLVLICRLKEDFQKATRKICPEHEREFECMSPELLHCVYRILASCYKRGMNGLHFNVMIQPRKAWPAYRCDATNAESVACIACICDATCAANLVTFSFRGILSVFFGFISLFLPMLT